MMIIEQIVTRVSHHLNISSTEVRELNMYHEGDITPYDMVLSNCTIRKCWEQLKETSSFTARRATVDLFNRWVNVVELDWGSIFLLLLLLLFRANRWKKRGLALTPTKFGVAFGAWFMNQGAALLHVYTDGSVLLSHGGMEMGQGLHTKMLQVCSCLLQISPDKIHIAETNSSVVANALATAASFSTDLYGMAVKVGSSCS